MATEETLDQILSNRGYDMAAEETLNLILSDRGLGKLYVEETSVGFYPTEVVDREKGQGNTHCHPQWRSSLVGYAKWAHCLRSCGIRKGVHATCSHLFPILHDNIVSYSFWNNGCNGREP